MIIDKLAEIEHKYHELELKEKNSKEQNDNIINEF